MPILFFGLFALGTHLAYAVSPSSAPAGRFVVMLSSQPSPPNLGDNQFLITVTDGGKPLSGGSVSVHVDMTAMPMPADFKAVPGPRAGRYLAEVNLSMAGAWTVEVSVHQMPGMTMAGDGTAHFALDTGKTLTVVTDRHPLLWVAALISFALLVFLVLFMRRLGKAHSVRGVAVGLITIAVVLAATMLVVRRYRDPTTATVIGSALMDMEAMKPVPSAVAVTTEIVNPTSFQETASYTGTVLPDMEEDIYPRVAGLLTFMPFYPGQHVQPGQVVARLDAKELEASTAGAAGGVRAAQEDVQTAVAQAKEAERAVSSAQAAVTQAQSQVASAQADVTYWNGQVPREQKLYDFGAIARQELDLQKSQAAAAKAKLSEMQAGVERAKQDLAQAEARQMAAQSAVRAARAKVAQARSTQAGAATMQGYTELRATHGGVVTARNVAPGVVVQPGTSIIKIAKTDEVRIQVNVSQRDLAAVHVGESIAAQAPDGGRPVAAIVSAIFPAAGSLDAHRDCRGADSQP